MSAEQIRKELEESRKYELDTFTFENATLVELSAENVAKVEAMIRTDSKYRILDIQDPEKSPYWIIELGKLLKGEKIEQNCETVVKNVVEFIDNENGTHLTGDCNPKDKAENARGQMEKRIKDHQHEILSYLHNPADSKDFDLIKELSRPTDHPLNGRSHISFASKFCHYACFYIFDGEDAQAKDNFSIYDKFVLEALPYYLKYYKDKKKIKNEIDLKKENGSSHYEYSSFQEVVDEVIKASGSQLSRNGFDHLLWYYFKGDRLKKEKSLKKYQNNGLLGKR